MHLIFRSRVRERPLLIQSHRMKFSLLAQLPRLLSKLIRYIPSEFMRTFFSMFSVSFLVYVLLDHILDSHVRASIVLIVIAYILRAFKIPILDGMKILKIKHRSTQGGRKERVRKR